MDRVALVILAVDDLAAAATFYLRAFRWRLTVETMTYVELETPGGLRLGIYHRHGYTKNFGEPTLVAHPGAGVTRTEIYVYVEDLATSLERVIDAGARLLSEPAMRSWGDTCAYVADPDGNVVVLAAEAG